MKCPDCKVNCIKLSGRIRKGNKTVYYITEFHYCKICKEIWKGTVYHKKVNQ